MINFDTLVQSYNDRLIEVISKLNFREISEAIGVIYRCWENEKNVIIFGNGGSAITAMHFVTDWSKMVPIHTGRQFQVKALVENIGLITAYANDFDYSEIFVRQLEFSMKKDDVIIAISGSGNSANIIKAVEFANNNGAHTIGLCGYDGGKLKRIAKHSVWANVNDMQLSEDIHAIFGHIVMKAICSKSFV